MIWGNESSKDPFQVILSKRIFDFSQDDIKKKKRSGMTKHQEWMISLGIKWNFPENAEGKLFYDPTTKGWDGDCDFGGFKAQALLVPEELYLKSLFLGYLP